MFHKIAMAVALTASVNALAADGDLVLDGEKWLAKSTGYRCITEGARVRAPISHERLNVEFEQLSTDRTLDNVLIKATFSEGSATCRYSALLFADNATRAIKRVDSKAFAPAADASCLGGKAVLDAQLAATHYLYWGHPHHATIMLPVSDAQEVCGAEATHVGIDFTASGRARD